MSGQLVGEVLAASDAMQEMGLPRRAFLALIAIAEKATTDTRQASVRWDYIRAALFIPASQKPGIPSTAKRAVVDLKAAGLIQIVRRGFDNQNGRSAAPIYAITERVTQMAQSVSGPTGHPDDPIDADRTGHSGEPFGIERTGQNDDRTGQNDDRTGHPDDPLDGSIDGPIDGGRADPPESLTSPAPNGVNQFQPIGPYGPRCRQHTNDPTPPRCPPCGDARKAAEANAAARSGSEQERKKAIRAAIDGCRDCDEAGRDDDLKDCPNHPNFRTAS